MPRNYKPEPGKKTYKKYDVDIIQKAVEELTIPNAKIIEIAEKYHIHKSVLYRHSKKIMKTQGGQTALGPDAELYIIENINKCAEWGYPMDTMDLRFIVKMYLDKLGVKHKKFKNNFPGPDFVEGFLKRHKHKISQRICENIKRPRAKVSPDIIKKYHEELQQSIDGVPPYNIINYDETNLSDDPGRKKVLMKRGCKYPERVINHSKVSTSIMIAGTADGDMLPPYVVYKASNLFDTWVENGPQGTRYNRSSSGWFEGTIFEDWVMNIVIPYCNDKPGRKILIGDNLSSHLSMNLITTCKEHNIDFVFLPANSTHLTQPLDVAFFRPMKRAWRQILLKWKKTDGRLLSTVPKGCFPKLLRMLLEDLKPNSKNNIMAGFKKTGIHPINLDELLTRLPQEERGDEELKTAINSSVLDLLKEMRFGTINITEPKRKRKLNVVAGKSVTAEETEKFADSETIKNQKHAKKNVQPFTSQIQETDDRKKMKGKGKKTLKHTTQNNLELLETRGNLNRNDNHDDKEDMKKKTAKDESIHKTKEETKTLKIQNDSLPSTSQAQRKDDSQKIKNKGKGKKTQEHTTQDDSELFESKNSCTTAETQANQKRNEDYGGKKEDVQYRNHSQDLTDVEELIKICEIDINSMPVVFVDEDGSLELFPDSDMKHANYEVTTKRIKCANKDYQPPSDKDKENFFGQQAIITSEIVGDSEMTQKNKKNSDEKVKKQNERLKEIGVNNNNEKETTTINMSKKDLESDNFFINVSEGSINVQEEVKRNNNLQGIDSMPLVYFDGNSAEVTVETDNDIQSLISENAKKSCIVITKQEVLESTHKIGKVDAHAFKPVLLNDNISLKKPNNHRLTQAKRKTKYQKNYYNNSQEILNIVTEND